MENCLWRNSIQKISPYKCKCIEGRWIEGVWASNTNLIIIFPFNKATLFIGPEGYIKLGLIMFQSAIDEARLKLQAGYVRFWVLSLEFSLFKGKILPNGIKEIEF